MQVVAAPHIPLAVNVNQLPPGLLTYNFSCDCNLLVQFILLTDYDASIPPRSVSSTAKSATVDTLHHMPLIPPDDSSAHDNLSVADCIFHLQ